MLLQLVTFPDESRSDSAVTNVRPHKKTNANAPAEKAKEQSHVWERASQGWRKYGRYKEGIGTLIRIDCQLLAKASKYRKYNT